MMCMIGVLKVDSCALEVAEGYAIGAADSLLSLLQIVVDPRDGVDFDQLLLPLAPLLEIGTSRRSSWGL